MNRLHKFVATLVALVWLPAVSCCLIDASGLLDKRDCCAHEQSGSVPDRNDCDKPCGALASASYVAQHDQLVFAPLFVPLLNTANSAVEFQKIVCIGHDALMTAPPEMAGHWQFSFRTALAPRAPAFVS